METNYWINRWQRGETGWHQTEVEPGLISHFSQLAPTRVFVPFCGKTLDLTWLAAQGHEVIGVELSELACRAFFEENKISVQTHKAGAFTVFQGGRVTIFNGDFFKFMPSDLGTIGALYDRAALIALPPEIRIQYTRHMAQLIGASSRQAEFLFLQVVLERTPQDSGGPPYSVTQDEINSLYGRDFEVQQLSCEAIEMNPGINAGVSEGRDGGKNSVKTEECIYRLVAKNAGVVATAGAKHVEPAIDPICGMTVDSDSELKAEFEGKKYFFCSSHCREEFIANPQNYLEVKKGFFKTYFPLLLILFYLLLTVGAAEFQIGSFTPMRAMTHFMGGFFLIFSFFKLLDLPGFVAAYRTYDLVAKRVPIYAWIYPWIELGLGLAYFSHSYLDLTNALTLILMTVSSLGVIQSLIKKSKIQCACLGTVFKLPMTQVTLFEDLLMAAMAAWGLISMTSGMGR